jgi:hypothetical protein
VGMVIPGGMPVMPANRFIAGGGGVLMLMLGGAGIPGAVAMPGGVPFAGAGGLA